MGRKDYYEIQHESLVMSKNVEESCVSNDPEGEEEGAE